MCFINIGEITFYKLNYEKFTIKTMEFSETEKQFINRNRRRASLEHGNNHLFSTQKDC